MPSRNCLPYSRPRSRGLPLMTVRVWMSGAPGFSAAAARFPMRVRPAAAYPACRRNSRRPNVLDCDMVDLLDEQDYWRLALLLVPRHLPGAPAVAIHDPMNRVTTNGYITCLRALHCDRIDAVNAKLRHPLPAVALRRIGPPPTGADIPACG